jgi:hypothetical protein
MGVTSPSARTDLLALRLGPATALADNPIASIATALEFLPETFP